jgi:hypothetical protein
MYFYLILVQRSSLVHRGFSLYQLFIRLFLSSCAKWYDIRETDLFQPSMLYDYSDFAQVSWHCLCNSCSVERIDFR